MSFIRAFTSCNPGTGEIYFTRPSWSEAELLARIASLKHFQKGWSESGIDARSDALKRLASALSAAKNQLAGKISQEVGRRTLECKSEIDRSIDLLHYYARSAPMTLMPKKVKTEATRSELFFEPLGLVLAIMPWNYPVWQVLRFAVPALVAGNACLVKPAPSVPQSTALLLDIVHSTGIQAMDVAWINEEHVEEAIRAADAVAFTGSTDVGRIVAAAAGKHIKKTVLELGGSNPLVVLKDADIHVAARDACYSRFRDAGQSCNAVKRMIVVPEIAEAFIAELIAEASKLKMGIQDDPNASLPPLARADLRETLHAQVLDATTHGAKLLLGGFMPEGPGFFYPATILDTVTPACRVYHEEIFGPVASILRADNEQDAIRMANDTVFGLGASIYTRNREKGWAIAKQIDAGSVFINRHPISDLRLPFGGIKASGYGRELSEFGLLEFVNVKTFWQK